MQKDLGVRGGGGAVWIVVTSPTHPQDIHFDKGLNPLIHPPKTAKMSVKLKVHSSNFCEFIQLKGCIHSADNKITP